MTEFSGTHAAEGKTELTPTMVYTERHTLSKTFQSSWKQLVVCYSEWVGFLRLMYQELCQFSLLA